MKKTMLFVLALSLFAPMAARPAFADDATTLALMKSIETKQDQILAELAAVKQELQIVKVRVTSQ